MKNLKELSIKDLIKIFENEAEDNALKLLAHIKREKNITNNDPVQIANGFNSYLADLKKSDPESAGRQERVYGPIIRTAVANAKQPQYKSWWAKLATGNYGLTNLAKPSENNNTINSSKIYIALGSTLFEVKMVALKNNRVGVKILERVKPTTKIQKFVTESKNTKSNFKIFLKSDEKFVSLTESKIWTTL